MTIEEILAAMQAILDQATGGADPADPAALSEADVARYEELEGKLKIARASAEIVKRHAAYKSVTTPVVFNTSNTEGDEISRAFTHFMKSGDADPNLIQRAQSEGVGSAGGYLVPEGFRAEIIKRLKAYGGFGNAAQPLSTASGNPLPWVTNDDVASLGGVTPEGGTISTAGSDLAFGTRVLNAYKYGVGGAGQLPLKVPFELLQDSAFDVQAFVAEKLAERIQRKLATDFVNGSGLNEPQGVLSASAGLATAPAIASNTVGPTYLELVSIIHALDPAYRSNARFVFNDATLAKIQKLVDSAGRPLIWDSNMNLTAAGDGLTLLGYPVIIDQAFPDPASANSFGFFGDVAKTYVVRSVKDFSLIVLNELYAPNGQVGYMGWGRWDGMVQDVNAGVLLKAA